MSNEMMTMLIKLQADVGELKGGLAQAQAAIKGVDDNVKTADGGMKKMIGSLKNVAATMGVAFAGTQLVQFAKDSVMAASNMAESLSKVRVVFGEGAAEVEAFGKSAAENMGISNQAALEAAGTYGNLFQAFGLGQPEAQKMSTSLVQLAADMASFNNTSVDDAIQALRSGLSGETEPLKRFGVALSDARLKTEALSLGLIKSTSEALTPAAKSQAAYALIMKDTTLAQGDYARTADGTANTMKTLQAKIADAKVALGDALMPAFRAMLGVLNLAVPLLKKLGDFFKNNQDEIKAFAIVLGIGAVAWGAYALATNAATIAQKALNAAQRVNPIMAIATGVAFLVALLVKAYKNVDWFREAVNNAAKFALTAFAAIIPIVGKVYEAIAKIVTGPLRGLLTALSKLPGVGKYAKGALDVINKGLDGISDLADSAAKKAKELADNLGKASKEAEKTKKSTDAVTKGTTKTTVDPNAAKAAEKAKKDLEKAQKQVQEIYKDMNDVIADANEKAQEALAKRDERIAEAQANYAERVADLQATYNKAVSEADRTLREDQAEARAENVKELARIAKDYADKKKDLEEKLAEKIADLREKANDKLLDLEEKYQDKVADLRKKAEEKSADIIAKGAEKRASLIQQSVDRLRSAFASKTGFDISEAFGFDSKTGKGASGEQMLAKLKDQLNQAKNLAEKAAFLQANGFSQTFIEQVMKAGPQAGNELADAILNATPETIENLKQTYNEMEKVSGSALDDLARTMNEGGNLATEELRLAYQQVTTDVQAALKQVNDDLNASLTEATAEYVKAKDDVAKELAKALADTQKDFDKAMADLAKARDERILEANAKLQEQLAEAQKRYDEAVRRAKEALDEGLADAQKTLQKALIDAQKDYEKAIDEINKATEKKLEELKRKLAEVAALIAQLASAQAAAAAMAAAPVYTPIKPTTTTTTTTTPTTSTTPNISVTQNFTDVKADPYAVNMATLNALKYGTTVTIGGAESATLVNATKTTATPTPISAAKLSQLERLF